MKVLIESSDWTNREVYVTITGRTELLVNMIAGSMAGHEECRALILSGIALYAKRHPEQFRHIHELLDLADKTPL